MTSVTNVTKGTRGNIWKQEPLSVLRLKLFGTQEIFYQNVPLVPFVTLVTHFDENDYGLQKDFKSKNESKFYYLLFPLVPFVTPFSRLISDLDKFKVQNRKYLLSISVSLFKGVTSVTKGTRGNKTRFRFWTLTFSAMEI